MLYILRAQVYGYNNNSDIDRYIFIIIIIRNKIKILYILRKYSKFHKGLLRLRSYYEIQNTYNIINTNLIIIIKFFQHGQTVVPS